MFKQFVFCIANRSVPNGHKRRDEQKEKTINYPNRDGDDANNKNPKQCFCIIFSVFCLEVVILQITVGNTTAYLPAANNEISIKDYFGIPKHGEQA